MKLMVVGGGGREHAIIKSLKKNPEVTEIFALPGNGGMADDATCVNIGAKDIDNIWNHFYLTFCLGAKRKDSLAIFLKTRGNSKHDK